MSFSKPRAWCNLSIYKKRAPEWLRESWMACLVIDFPTKLGDKQILNQAIKLPGWYAINIFAYIFVHTHTLFHKFPRSISLHPIK